MAVIVLTDDDDDGNENLKVLDTLDKGYLIELSC